MQFTVTRRTAQLLTALGLIAAAILLAVERWWPFDTSPPALPQDKPTFWQFLLSDHLTLGFVRLGVVMLAVFVIASIPALITGGRWLKGFGTTGLTADDAAADANKTFDEFKRQADEATQVAEAAKKERDEFRAVATKLVKANEPGGGPSA